MQYKKLKLGINFLIILLLLSPIAVAFGVTAMYWDTKPLRMYPGQSTDTALILQNMEGDEEAITLKAELVQGAEIATLTDTNLEYIVPFGRKDIYVPIEVKIPEDAPIGTTYTIEVSFVEIASQEGRMMQMTKGIGKRIPVIVESRTPVAEEPEVVKARIPSSIIVLAVIAVIIIAYLILKRKKKKR